MLNTKTLDQIASINTKWIRVITVLIYCIAISLIGIVLGLFYLYAWSPNYDYVNKIDKHNIEMKLNQTIPIGKIQVVNEASELEALSVDDIGSKLMNILVESLKKENAKVSWSHENKQSLNAASKHLENINGAITNRSFIFSFQIDFNEKKLD